MAGSRSPGLPRVVRIVGRWLLTSLATGALLALTLVVAIAAMGPNWPTRDDATHLPAVIRALHATSSEVEDELLVEVSFTPDELPTGDAQVLFYRLTLTPGTSLPAPVKASWLCLGGLVATGVGIEVVQSGTYGLQRATSFRVQRKTGPGVEEVAARQDILLGPGDAAIYGDYAQRGTIRNTGTEPVVVIGMAVVTMAGSGSELPPLPEGVRVELLASSLATDWANLPDGPVAVSLWRLRLPERSSVGPYAGAGLEALAVEQGMISRRYLRLAATTTDVPPEVLYPWEQSIFLAPAPHIRRSFTAGDDDPAVLLALSIEPQAIWSATLAP